MSNAPAYLPRTWFHPQLRSVASEVHGTGLVCDVPLGVGDLVIVWGGTPYSVSDLKAGRVPGGISYSVITENLLLAAPAGDLDYFLNHSCDPNVWLEPGLRIVARRPIPAGAELYLDYVTVESEPEYRLAPCRCETPVCRGEVTGSDWQLPELQERYAGHFLPIITRR